MEKGKGSAELSGKKFFLDTNVLLHDPEALTKFEENEVVIPIMVIEELDKIKKGEGEIPYSARAVLKMIDSLRELGGDLTRGAALPNGGILRIETDLGKSNKSLKEKKNDNLIITSALGLKKRINGNGNVILVSKDTSVRIKAHSLGLNVQDYLNDKTTVFMKYGNVATDEGGMNGIKSVRYQHSGDKIFRLYGDGKMELIRRQRSIMNIVPKNIEQECAIDALLAPQISVVALTGRAGTGKTLLAIAAGLHLHSKSLQKGLPESFNKCEQVMVARPIVPMGNDLGYLPGDIKEKLHLWMQPIYDNLDVIVGTPREHEEEKDNDYRSADYLIESGIIHIEALTYIRGRSLPRRFLIIDEAQNLRPLDVKTIITRCGEGTKVIFTGDLEQIDSPYLDAASNGLAFLIKKFIDEENFCYLNLIKSARSALAEQAAKLL